MPYFVFCAIIHVKYWNRREFCCPKISIWGLWKAEFVWKYVQNNFRNKFPDHENIGIDTLFEFVGTIFCVLFHNSYQILKSEKDWLLGKCIWGLLNEFEWKYDLNNFRNEFLDRENVGIDTLFELVGTIGCVLCHNACLILKSQLWLPQSKYLRAIKCQFEHQKLIGGHKISPYH